VFRAGRCPLLHEFRAAVTACQLHEKVREAAEEGTKEGAKSAKKRREKMEEISPCRTLTGCSHETWIRRVKINHIHPIRLKESKIVAYEPGHPAIAPFDWSGANGD
jgi:hypothetical protein